MVFGWRGGLLEVDMHHPWSYGNGGAWWPAAGWGGMALFGAVLMSLPLSAQHLAQLQALNRELGRLCANPPRQALTVCRLHARLVSSL